MSSSSSGASASYKGYRLQALYTLWRILRENRETDLIFQPEGQEDLAILDARGNLLEIIQVKSHAINLTLSSFAPEKPDSFFYRVSNALKEAPAAQVSIASYGPVGPELQQAIEGNRSKREEVAKKIGKHARLTQEDASNLLGRIRLKIVDEQVLRDEVYATLEGSLVGVDRGTAFELLTFWLYICAENRRRISRDDVLDRVNKVGRFISARATHLHEWFTTIIPLEKRQIEPEQQTQLEEEFYRGVYTRYDHILAGLDVVRPTPMQDVDARFQQSHVVIIHGASGQGKTTLAYRYLEEYFPALWRFKVQAVESRTHALSVATALVGHADAIGVRMLVYLDVSSRDAGWPELAKQLSAHENIRVLITIREEDFQRANVVEPDFDFALVGLSLDRQEAQQIYNALTERAVSTQFLNFEEAWTRFGGEGPLLEFVYLITQGASLRERLTQQVTRLRDEVRRNELSRAELDLLRWVSVASAYEARLKIRPLADALSLTEPTRTFSLFEKEYLLRVSDNGALVQAVHPIRSAILAELLTDAALAPWSQIAHSCLPFIPGADIEAFLLHAFSRRPTDTEELVGALASYRCVEWMAIAGITRALIWLGIREYVEENLTLIQ